MCDSKNKVDIIQFLPYFPPHKGGLETVAEEIGIHWIKNNLGTCINVITHFDQEGEVKNNNKIEFEGNIIGYKKDGVENLVVPSFEIINNFPVYKFWSPEYKNIKKYLKSKCKNKEENYRIITHTRFFLTTLIGGLFARKNQIKWGHIEHGSDYVQLSSKLKSRLAYIYDRIIGKWIFKTSNKVLAISHACKDFIVKEFANKEVDVFYRGIEIPTIKGEKKGEIKIIFVGRLVKLKGVDLLIQAYKKSNIKNKLIVIGDGEERESLKEISQGNNIEFLGQKSKEFIIGFLSQNNYIFVNPSYQEGLPTTVIEGLLTGNVVVATDVGGTREISDKKDLIIFSKGNVEELREKILETLMNYEKLVGKSRVEVEKKFSWEKNIFNLLKFMK